MQWLFSLAVANLPILAFAPLLGFARTRLTSRCYLALPCSLHGYLALPCACFALLVESSFAWLWRQLLRKALLPFLSLLLLLASCAEFGNRFVVLEFKCIFRLVTVCRYGESEGLLPLLKGCDPRSREACLQLCFDGPRWDFATLALTGACDPR